MTTIVSNIHKTCKIKTTLLLNDNCYHLPASFHRRNSSCIFVFAKQSPTVTLNKPSVAAHVRANNYTNVPAQAACVANVTAIFGKCSTKINPVILQSKRLNEQCHDG
jgi:hypothetical protein